MRILHIIQRYPPAIGGSETWCQGLCRYQAEQGHEVKVLTLNVYNEDEFWKEPPVDNCTVRFGRIEYDGKIKVIRYRRTKIHPFVFLLFKAVDKLLDIYFYGPHSLDLYLGMAKEIRKSDIVHLHTIPYPHNFIAYVIARLCRRKIAITPHFHPNHHYYERKSNYALIKRCDAIFSVSDFEKEYFIDRGIKKSKIFVAYNAVDPAQYKPQSLLEFKKKFFDTYSINDTTPIFVFIGRKIEYKGVDTLINAVRQLVKESDMRLFLVGPDFPWFIEFYARLSAQERRKIIDLGVISHQEKVNLLYLTDALVLPSKFEAFGIVLLEAWICGLPVIGTKNGGMPGLIGNCGLTCNYGDVEGLKEKISLIMRDKKLSENMAHNGRTKVLTHYTWDNVGRQASSVYSNLFGNGKRRIVVGEPHA